jgi:hypothetical protein
MKTSLTQVAKDGAFKRSEAKFRGQVAPGTEFEPESARSCCIFAP